MSHLLLLFVHQIGGVRVLMSLQDLGPIDHATHAALRPKLSGNEQQQQQQLASSGGLQVNVPQLRLNQPAASAAGLGASGEIAARVFPACDWVDSLMACSDR